MDNKEFALRFDNVISVDQIREALSGETKPTVIIVGHADVGAIGATKIAALLKEANVPLIVGDVSDINDEELLKTIAGMSDTQLGIATNPHRNMAALQPPLVMKIENIMRDYEPTLFLKETKRNSPYNKNQKNQNRHFNRNQNFKGRK
jgi:hypothetical protein